MSNTDDDEKTVRLAYASNTNISFHGTWDTGYTREQWDELSQKDKDRCMEEAVWDIVEMWELEDDEPDYNGGWSR